jgi:hypothetical protein
VPACARARVSAAFLADRLRRAAFLRRVATAFCAAAFRWVSVWVAMLNHPSCGSLATPSHLPKPRGRENADPLPTGSTARCRGSIRYCPL